MILAIYACSHPSPQCMSLLDSLQIKRDKVTRLVVLPLYPHFSISTSASSLRLFEAMLQKDVELEVSQAACRPPMKQLCWCTALS